MNPEIDQYIAHLELAWQAHVVAQLRELIFKAAPEAVEQIKWGSPHYSDHGPLVWIFCAKEWVHVSFVQGALLDSSHGLFEATDNKAQRTIKFCDGDKIPKQIIINLTRQAVRNNRADKKIKFAPSPKIPVELPSDITKELKSHKLDDEFWERTYYQQKGYVQWINESKRPETRTKRIQTMLQELRDGTYMPPKNTL